MSSYRMSSSFLIPFNHQVALKALECFHSIQKLLRRVHIYATRNLLHKDIYKNYWISSCNVHDTIIFMQNWWRGTPPIFYSCRWRFYSLTFFSEEDNSLERDIQNSFWTRTWIVVKYGFLAWMWCAESTLPHCSSRLSVHQLAISWKTLLCSSSWYAFPLIYLVYGYLFNMIPAFILVLIV